MHEAKASKDQLMLDPSSLCFYSLMSAESFSEPARSTMLNFEVMIGLDVLSGRLSNEIKITA